MQREYMTTNEKKSPDWLLVAGREKLRSEVSEHFLQQKMLQGPGRSNQGIGANELMIENSLSPTNRAFVIQKGATSGNFKAL